MALSAARAIVSLSRGEWPAEKVVNPEVRERFRW
jgi:D-3-phosphoglycerate dehydrogenase/(S)-sulfolactate dehydrogenase